MEKRINAKIDEYLHEFKDAIKNKIVEMEFEEPDKASELAAFVYDYDKLIIVKDTITKPKRSDDKLNLPPEHNRCIAKRASGEQCTRRRKEGTELCGTHCKGIPHGQVPFPEVSIQQVKLFTEKIHGIVYFLDHGGHVYNTEEVLENKQNPSVVATWVKSVDGRCVIPEWGLL